MPLKTKTPPAPKPIGSIPGKEPQQAAGLTRLHYFHGRLLSAEDLTREQDYLLQARWRHNRLLHGCGIVTGLQVLLGNLASGPTIRVQPGLAIDPLGREVVVTESTILKLPAAGALYVAIRYLERAVGSIPTLPGSANGSELALTDLIEEAAEVILESEEPLVQPRRKKPSGCDWDHLNAVPLARLRFSRGKWRLDHHFRAPRLP